MLSALHRVLFTSCASLALAGAALAQSQAHDVAASFAERFALAADRRAAIDELVPGSDDFFYYHCLQRQHEGAFAEVQALLDEWIRGHGRSARTIAIEHRQALLTFDRDANATYDYLRRQLDVTLDAQPRSRSGELDLPTTLDPALLDRTRLDEQAFGAEAGTVNGFELRALRRLATVTLTDSQLLSLLQRLERPDVPNLPALIARALALPQSRGFGTAPIHRQLLLAQLEELVRLRPQLLADSTLVEVWLQRLRPAADVDWQHDAAARLAYLERLQAFADRLPPAHASLQAHIRYHRLRHDLAAGKLDRERLLAYLRLPRPSAHVADEHRRQHQGREAQLDLHFPTGLEAIGTDEVLVHACLSHFFASDDDWRGFAPYVEQSYLEQLHAETQLLLGRGDPARCYAVLGPQAVEQLQQRVEFAFAPTQPTQFVTGDTVVIEADVKNTRQLLVKVFAIDTYDYEREHGREIDSSLDLAGLVANEERALSYDDEPLRRVRRRFEFPLLTEPGTYVIEFLGGGLASRAVIRKGRLGHLARVGAAGHVLTVLDENGAIVPDATAWCAGREYATDSTGAITIPFATEHRANQRLVLRRGRLTSLSTFDHLIEHYRLEAGVMVPRESLLAGSRAKVLIRPTLRVYGEAIALSLLEQPELVITAVDLDGVESAQTVRDLTLSDDAELVHEITVPQRLSTLRVMLRGKVTAATTGEQKELESATARFDRNGIDTTTETDCLLLGSDGDGWYMEARGRNGESVAGVGFRLWLQSPDHVSGAQALLQTDRQGRARLGALAGVPSISAQSLAHAHRIWSWPLELGANRIHRSLHGVVGQALRVPFVARGSTAGPGAVSLLEVHDGAFVRDASAQLAVTASYVELRQLTAGDYVLWLPGQDERIEVRVAAGVVRAGWVIGGTRALAMTGSEQLRIDSITPQGDVLQVRLGNSGATARVHVFATRYPTAYDPFARLQTAAERDDAVHTFSPTLCDYRAALPIGDEYRYVLDRRFRSKFPGNMLQRPSLLLNPWRLEAATAFDANEWNVTYGSRGGARGRQVGSNAESIGARGHGSRVSEFADLDFLPAPAPLLANLRPDRDGVVRVPIAQLGHGHLVHVLAIAGDDTAYLTTTLPEPALTPRDRSLQRGLDPAGHFTEQRRIESVAAGATTTIADPDTAELVRYDTLAQAFQLLQTLSSDAELPRFAWLMQWPSLAADEQLRRYSEHACHELHFFLFHKDRPFFDRVIRPYLQNKLDKTLLDHWLLGNDLSAFAEPWAFARLNIVEQILLTRRLPGRREAGARHVGDLTQLTARSAESTAELFRRVLAGQALQQPTLGDEPSRNAFKKLANESDEEAAKGVEPPPPPPESNDDDRGGDFDVPETVAAADPRHDDLARRNRIRRQYQPPSATQTYAENNYWHVPIERQNAALITANGFWHDYALAAPDQPFGSMHLAEASGSVAEMLMALAVLDLPFAATAPTQRSGELTATTPFLLARREIRPAAAAVADSPLLIGQSFAPVDDNTGRANDGEAPRAVREFVAGVPYRCQVTLSNTGAAELRLDLLLQIPRGAMPLRSGAVTRGMPVTLAPFRTETFDYVCYFPVAGDFPHFPAHAARSADGALLANAPPMMLHVVATPTLVDTTSWSNVAREGSDAEVLTFLDTHNTAQLELSAIAWRMHDAAMFRGVIERLRSRLHYDDVLWAYGLLHQDRGVVHEWLAHRDYFVAACGAALQSPLLAIDPVTRHSYQHVEFAPLFHARAHALGAQPVNRNRALATQYDALLDVLCHRAQLDAHDWMSVTCYLLLQDRIADGLAAFAKVDAAALPSRLQYDYCRCYLDFFADQHTVARGIAEGYRDYPVTRWRELFVEVIAQLDEAAGSAAGTQSELVASEPALDLTVADGKVTLRYQNLTQCTVSCYPLDVEFAFTTAPFGALGSAAAAYVVPNHQLDVALPADQRELIVELPRQFRRSDVLVEAAAAGITRRCTSLDHALAVQTIESYGQLQVRHAATGQPLPKVYVKVYAKLNDGTVRFHKDGYTDLRGRFDCASVSNDNLAAVQRFSVLVLSETDGAEIRELAPPR